MHHIAFIIKKHEQWYCTHPSAHEFRFIICVSQWQNFSALNLQALKYLAEICLIKQNKALLGRAVNLLVLVPGFKEELQSGSFETHD